MACLSSAAMASPSSPRASRRPTSTPTTRTGDRNLQVKTPNYCVEESTAQLESAAPLAHRLGIGHIKWELEDLSFRYLEPTQYKQIATLLDERRLDRQQYIDAVMAQLRESLEEASIHADITGRAKHIYSIWRKMQRRDAAPRGPEQRHPADSHASHVSQHWSEHASHPWQEIAAGMPGRTARGWSCAVACANAIPSMIGMRTSESRRWSAKT
mgnify:CR=1 FL=1